MIHHMTTDGVMSCGAPGSRLDCSTDTSIVDCPACQLLLNPRRAMVVGADDTWQPADFDDSPGFTVHNLVSDAGRIKVRINHLMSQKMLMDALAGPRRPPTWRQRFGYRQRWLRERIARRIAPWIEGD